MHVRLDGKRRGFRLVVGAIAVAAAASLAASGCSVRSPVAQSSPQSAPAIEQSSGVGVLKNAPLTSAFASPPAKLPPRNPFTGPPADPFTGTPADHWADGAAGIVVPAARPIGGYTAAQVKFAYERTRELLIAADLNRRTLLGGPPTAYANLLSKPQRTEFLAGLHKKGLDKQGASASTRAWVVSFAPGGTQLIGNVIKVHGSRMHARAAKVGGGYDVLDVDVDYIFVYPVQPPHEPTRWMRIVARSAWTVQFGDWRGAATTFEPWVQFSGGYIAGADCGTEDGYVHPDYPGGARLGGQPSVTPSGTPVDPYSQGSVASPGCGATTGT
jgi:hypothetical protein